MFIGHYGVSMAAKTISPKTPIWVLLVATQLLDICWAIFVATGIELVSFDETLASNPLVLHYMPYSHSLAAACFWSVLAFFVVRLPPIQLTAQQAILVALVVASHWLLDLIVHREDLLIAGDVKVGLGLWELPTIAFLVELGVLVLGAIMLYSSHHFHTRFKLSIVYLSLGLVLLHFGSWFGMMPHVVLILSASALTIYFLVALIGNRIERQSET